MATYTYIDKAGTQQSVQADTPEMAIKSAPNIDPNSGVQLNATQTSPTAPTSTPTGLPSIATTTPGIGNPVSATTLPAASTPAPTLPSGTATDTYANYFTSLTETQQNQRKALEDEYKTQVADYQKKIEESNKKIQDLTTLQSEGVLTNIDKLSQPFRADLEKTMSEKLYVDENFQANQKLVNELDTLLTEGNNLIKQAQGKAIATSILNKEVAKTMSDVSARAGVIQAVISARNGQIGQAQNMIDRAINAVTADNNDRINYYKTLYNFYEGQKSAEGTKLLNLTKDQKTYIDSQINLLENDNTRATANAEKLKAAMIDPDTALAYASSGVSLNDTPAQISKKLADYAYSKEVSNSANEFAKAGYTAVLPGQSAPAGTQVVTTTDSKGVTRSYYKKKETSDKPTYAEQLQADVAEMSSRLDIVVGSDGYVSPKAYAEAKKAWVAEGRSPTDFDKYFEPYRNPDDTYIIS